MVSLNSNLFHSRPSVWRSVKVVLISVDRVRIPIYLSSHTHANLPYLTHSDFRFCCFGWPSDSPQWIRGLNDDDYTSYCLPSNPISSRTYSGLRYRRFGWPSDGPSPIRIRYRWRTISHAPSPCVLCRHLGLASFVFHFVWEWLSFTCTTPPRSLSLRLTKWLPSDSLPLPPQSPAYLWTWSVLIIFPTSITVCNFVRLCLSLRLNNQMYI